MEDNEENFYQAKKYLGFTLDEIKSFKLSLASPESIRSWSLGEVKKPETINYKSFKPEAEGLFCQKIFGPEKDYECACGKYKQQKHKGKTCEKCGVEVIESKARRFRMGHIELAEPIAHIWYFKVTPYYLSIILNVNSKDLRSVIYLAAHIVISTGEIGDIIKQNQIIEPEKSRATFIKIIQWIIDNKVKEGSFAAEEAAELLHELQQTYKAFNFAEIADFIEEHTGAKYGSGALAVEQILKKMNLESHAEEIQDELDAIILKGKSSNKEVLGSVKARRLLKRLEVIKSFIKNQTKPEWTIMKSIPVLPPDLRPLIPLQGGRFTSSDVNDLYRSVIIRNEKLKEFLSKPYTDEIILNNARRLLQDSVDTLFDNSRRDKPKMSKDKKRAVKSLADTIKGKAGRFRQNLLGKRVDYSARSVIVVGPDLKMDECGLPVDMVLKLFEPFILNKLVESEVAQNAKAAQMLIEEKSDKIWPSVEVALAERPVLLNRAPTLHRLSVQAFYPKMIKGKVIRLHPLATPAFNADFDGDQMAVHVPVTDEGVYEAQTLLLGSKNILGLKDGKPIVTPSQDMVLGNYYLTIVKQKQLGEGMIFASFNEVKRAYDLGNVALHAIIALPMNAAPGKFRDFIGTEFENGYVVTTTGKAIFNAATPDEFHWINEPTTKNVENSQSNYLIKKGEDVRKIIAGIKPDSEQWSNFMKPFCKRELGKIIFEVFTSIDKDPLKPEETVIMCDNLKDLGFEYATKAGITVSIGDIKVDPYKYELFKIAEKQVRECTSFYEDGLLTKEEKSRLIIDIWTDVKDKVQIKAKEVLESNKENPIYMMSDSGARGNISNFTQLAGMRGLMAAPKIQVDKGVREGKVIETPVKSSFIEGLSTSEFFTSTHGARKGLTDTALNTGISGYFTRKLVDVATDIIVKEADCGSKKGYEVTDITDTTSNAVIIPLRDRIIGRTAFEDLVVNDEVVTRKGELISRNAADKIFAAGIKSVMIRSVFTCNIRDGVCQSCYGKDLATNQLVKEAEAVGVIAAQSVGEPGTQLTMRTFHTGGVAGGGALTDGFPGVVRLLDAVKTNSIVNFSEHDGKILSIESDKEEGFKITVEYEGGEKVYLAKSNPIVRVRVGDEVKKGTKLFEGRSDLRKLLDATGDRTDVWNYMIKELHKIYKTNAGVTISDKYFEIILKKLTSFEEVINPGGTDLIPNHVLTTTQVWEANEKAEADGKDPATTKPFLEGAKFVPRRSPSFLVGASFSHAVSLLVKATIFQQVDPLKGVNENILLGRKIPAGTGIVGIDESKLLRNIRTEIDHNQPLEESENEFIIPENQVTLEETGQAEFKSIED